MPGGQCAEHHQDKKPSGFFLTQRHLGQPQSTHLPEQLLRVSQCSYSCTSWPWKTRCSHHPKSSAARTWQWVLLSAPRSKEGAEQGPSCGLVAQLPLCASVSSVLRARCWPEHELCQLLLPAVHCRQELPAQAGCQVLSESSCLKDRYLQAGRAPGLSPVQTPLGLLLLPLKH